MNRSRRACLALLTCTALLLVPASGLAAGGTFNGKTSQNRPVTFKIADGKVKRFKGGVNLFCIGQGIEFNTAIPPKAMKIRSGKFSYKGDDSEGNSNIEIRGTVRGSKVTGKVSMTHSTYDASSRMFVGCSGEAKFTAKKR